MKKIFIICLLIITFITLTGIFTACYVSNPAKMSDLVGTYQLTTYTRRPKGADAEDESATVNMIDEYGIVAYLVVKSNGTGYYVYKSKDVELKVDSIQIEYSYDDDDSSKIKEITYQDGSGASGNLYPGKGKEHLGLNFKKRKKEKYLEYYYPTSDLMKRDYSQNVEYTKVDEADDLSYVSKKMGSSLYADEYAVKNLDTFLVNNYSESYVYVAVSFDKNYKTASYYYMLKSDRQQRSETNLNVKIEYQDTIAVISIGDHTFKRNLGVLYNSIYTTLDGIDYFTLAPAYFPEPEQYDTDEKRIEYFANQEN